LAWFVHGKAMWWSGGQDISDNLNRKRQASR
jgi:hypothetical protein